MKAGTKETVTKIVRSCMCGIYSEEGLTVLTDGQKIECIRKESRLFTSLFPLFFLSQKYYIIVSIEKQLFLPSSPLFSSSLTGSMTCFLSFVFGHHSTIQIKNKTKQIKNYAFSPVIAKRTICVYQHVFSLKAYFGSILPQ